jgi:5-methylcytosine-specific restriction protein A
MRVATWPKSNGALRQAREMFICPLCDRAVIYANAHHFVPRAKGGKETVDICIACHNTIHDLFTNNELRDVYNSLTSLKENQRFSKYLKWIKGKPAEFVPCFKTKK